MGEPGVFRDEALEHYWTRSRTTHAAALPRTHHGALAAALVVVLGAALALAWTLRVPLDVPGTGVARGPVPPDPSRADREGRGLLLALDGAARSTLRPPLGTRVRASYAGEILHAAVIDCYGPLEGEALRGVLPTTRSGSAVVIDARWDEGTEPPPPGTPLEAWLELGRVRVLTLVPGLGWLAGDEPEAAP